MVAVLLVVTAYLCGSLPIGVWMGRWAGVDIRSRGSGNIGATNVARSGAKGLGIATLILDAAKGYAAVIVARIVGIYVFRVSMQENWDVLSASARHDLIWIHFSKTMAIAAVFAIIGHMFPVWLKFKGGKGVATGVGVFLALAPAAVGLVLIIFIVIVGLSRYVSLGSIVATAAFPVFAWLLYRNSAPNVVFLAAAIAAFLIIAKHHQNIRRLIAGSESKFGVKKQTEVQA